MPELKKQEKLKVAVVIDGNTFITSDEGVLFEYTTENEILLYIKSKEENKEIKIKISNERN
jgi:hypothetical protein